MITILSEEKDIDDGDDIGDIKDKLDDIKGSISALQVQEQKVCDSLNEIAKAMKASAAPGSLDKL